MSNSIKCSVLLALTAWLMGAPGAAAKDKIGYVNLMVVLDGTEDGKATMAKLRKEIDVKEAEFKKRGIAFREKVKQFQSRAKMMKEEKVAEQAMKLQKEEQDLQLLGIKYQGEFQNKKAEALAGFQKKVQDVIEFVAKREGLTFVVRQEALLYGPPKMDLTNQVIREYDKRFKGKKSRKGK